MFYGTDIWIHMDIYLTNMYISPPCVHTHDIPPRYPSKIHITTSSRHAGPRDHRSLGGSADKLCFVGSCHGSHAERWHLGCRFCGIVMNVQWKIRESWGTHTESLGNSYFWWFLKRIQADGWRFSTGWWFHENQPIGIWYLMIMNNWRFTSPFIFRKK